MAGTSAALELSKVKFGGKPLKLNDDDWSSGDETESDVTEPDEDASEPTYFPGTSSSTTLVKSQETDENEGEKGADEVDAIRWARYRDSRGIRPDGKVGWHYCVMWTGYLKTASDTEEFITSFDTDENGQNQLVTDFWEAVGRPMRKNKRGRIIEPLGAIGEVMEPSKDLIKRWIKDARPRRSFKLYKIRAEREKSIPPQKIRKRDSDYYYHKRLVLRAEAEKLRESQLVSADSTQQGDAGPSTQASRNAASQLSHITATPSSQSTQEHEDGSGKSNLVGKAIVKGKGKAKEEKAVDPALASLFEDDVIVAVDTPEGSETKKKKKKKEKNKDGLKEGSINDSPAPSENGSKKEKKRKRESGLAESSTPGPSGQRKSPEKKKRVASPIKPSQPVPPTPQVVPPTPITAGFKIKFVAAPQGNRAGSPGPSRSAPSPTPPTIPRPQQEPLFLDAAPSPADTFGEPMPGFFDSRPQSRISSLSLSQPKSIPASLPTPLLTAKIEPVDPEPSQRALSRGTAGISNHADTLIDLAEQEEEEEENVNNALLDPVVLERPKSRSKSKSPSPLPPVRKVASPVPRPNTAVVSPAEAVPPPEKIQTEPPSNSNSPHAGTEPTTKDVSQKDPPSASLSSLAPAAAMDKSVPSIPGISHPTAPSSEVSPATVGKASLPTATAPSAPTSDKAGSSFGPGSTTDDAVKPLTVTPVGISEQGRDTIAPAKAREPSPVRAPTGIPTSFIDSPPMEPPVPTFVSPRKVSRSPSLPMDMDMDMDISSSPIQPPESEDRNPEGGISPPRYVLKSPDKAKTLPPPPSKPPSPVRIKIPISERPKYVQPSRIQVLADIVDPEAAARQARLAAKKGPPPPLMHAHPSLPDRPTPVSAPIHPSRLALVEGGNRGPMTAPVQPRGFGPTPPSGPSGSRQSGPLADQKEAYKGVRPPWEKRKRGADVSGGQSPMIHAPPGPSAMRTDQWRPAPQIPYLPYGGQSPAWAPNATGNPYSAVPPVVPGRSPMYGVQPHVPQSVDPRGGASPALSLMSPNPALYGDGHPQSIDPRRRGSDQPGMAPGQSPLHTPMSPVANSGSVGPRRITQLGRITAYLKSPHIDAEETRFSLNIMQGAFNGFMLEGDRVLGMVLANKGTSKPVDMPMDEVDSSLIGWQMRYGAKLVQWAKVGLAGGPPAEWEQFKMKAMQRGRAWVTFTENLAPDNTVMEHFAIIMAPAKFVEQSILALGLGPWSTVSEIGIALLVLAIPLDTFPPPMIPNPVRPDIAVEEDKKVPNTVVTPTHLFASYGLSPEYFRSLRQTRAVRYPGQEGHYDVLHFLVEHEFSVNDVIPYDEFHAPENVLFMNNKFNRAVKSSTLDKTVNRRTRYFSTGPALHLLPSQWRLREIWSTGGLVTFSPTFILRSPEKVAEIMSMIRIAPNWAAYVTPQVVQWVNASWRMPARCPNPTLAYQTFTQSLFLDQNLLNLSGSPAAAGGGLAVSTCPPLMSHSERCARWLEWLQQSSTATDYQTLVDLCHDYVRARGPGTGTGKTGMENELDLELVDIEKKQLEDLTNMRKSPHLLPYRRYIFIGEVSLPKDKKDRYGAGIEYVDPDSFAAIFSGAI